MVCFDPCSAPPLFSIWLIELCLLRLIYSVLAICLICELVASKLRHISMLSCRFNFECCSSRFRVLASATPSTILSRISESCRQAQKPHVCANVLNLATYSSIVSRSCWARLLKLYLSYVSLTWPIAYLSN